MDGFFSSATSAIHNVFAYGQRSANQPRIALEVSGSKASPIAVITASVVRAATSRAYFSNRLRSGLHPVVGSTYAPTGGMAAIAARFLCDWQLFRTTTSAPPGSWCLEGCLSRPGMGSAEQVPGPGADHSGRRWPPRSWPWHDSFGFRFFHSIRAWPWAEVEVPQDPSSIVRPRWAWLKRRKDVRGNQPLRASGRNLRTGSPWPSVPLSPEQERLRKGRFVSSTRPLFLMPPRRGCS
jgi:hypothetical protein